ncbi:MAG: polysaccharide pyruvyl transferase family protein [Akkermansia sp.]|nr:polysaccharide pyruvyl transferase family protein [Akkermansia sp.]
MPADPETTLQTPHDTCTGCSACSQRCPAHAISMEPDEEGFIRARVDAAACIHCGLCNKVCPAAGDKATNPVEPLAAYAAWNGNEDELKLSSSGGIFSLLARRTLALGGVVCGSVYDDAGIVHHAFAEDEAGLARMRGSKYVQSEMRDCYGKTMEFLRQGRHVLFTGVPCQVGGLRSYLGREYDNLLTMEIICEGAPSPGLFALHLRQQCPELRKVHYLSFRDKRSGWAKLLVVDYETESGERRQFTSPAREDGYMRAMSGALSQGRNCYNCRFREGRSGADISIGDMWAISIVAPEIPHPRGGASTVFTNTPKGAAAYAEVAGRLAFNKTIHPLAATVNNGYVYRAPAIAPEARAEFFRCTHAGLPLAQAADNALRKSNCVAILNHAGHYSYGSNLTAFALQEYLRRRGHAAYIVSLRPFRSPYPDRIKPYLSFINGAMRWTGHCYGPSDCATLNNDFDTFIAGSDQIFRYPRPWIRRCAEPSFYLEFAAPGKRRIAYAASFGLDTYQGPKRQARRFHKALRDFDAVSMRERQGLDILRERFNYTGATAVLDPVFLLSSRDWNRFALASPIQVPENRLTSFFFFSRQRATDALDACAARNALHPFNLNAAKVDIMGWLKITSHSSFIVTDSFHMMCFAIIYHKPFAVISAQRFGKARLLDLLQNLNLETRLIDLDEPSAEGGALAVRLQELYATPIPYDEVEARLAPLREQSAQWLMEALSKPVSPKKRVIRHSWLRSLWEQAPWRLFQLYLSKDSLKRAAKTLLLLRPGKREALRTCRGIWHRMWN